MISQSRTQPASIAASRTASSSARPTPRPSRKLRSVTSSHSSPRTAYEASPTRCPSTSAMKPGSCVGSTSSPSLATTGVDQLSASTSTAQARSRSVSGRTVGHRSTFLRCDKLLEIEIVKGALSREERGDRIRTLSTCQRVSADIVAPCPAVSRRPAANSSKPSFDRAEMSGVPCEIDSTSWGHLLRRARQLRASARQSRAVLSGLERRCFS